MSGCGFPRSTSSRVTTQLNVSIQDPWFAIFRASVSRVELVPTAIGTPPATSAEVSSTAPGRGGASGSRVSSSASRSSWICRPGISRS
jgi:hypothetical protein